MFLGNIEKNKGFSLLEVMISAVILSIGMIAVLNSFIKADRTIEFLKDRFRAELLLESKLFEIYNSDIEDVSREGIFYDFQKPFLWQLDMRGLEEPLLDEIHLKISWNRGKNRYNISGVTYIID